MQLLMQRNDAGRASPRERPARGARRPGRRSRRRAARGATHPLRPPVPVEPRLPARSADRSAGSATGSRRCSGRSGGSSPASRGRSGSRADRRARVHRRARGAGPAPAVDAGAGRDQSRRAPSPADDEDPDALERAADEAERDGDLARALRLRFRAGLLRLGDRGAIHYRPSVTTGEVRRTLGSATFDDLAGTFEAVTYGGRTAAPARRRHRPPRVAARARRDRAPVSTPGGAATDRPARASASAGRRLWIGVVVVVGGVHPRQPARAGTRPRGRRRRARRRRGLVVRDRARRPRRVRDPAGALRPSRRIATRCHRGERPAFGRDRRSSSSPPTSPTTTRRRCCSSSRRAGDWSSVATRPSISTTCATRRPAGSSRATRRGRRSIPSFGDRARDRRRRARLVVGARLGSPRSSGIDSLRAAHARGGRAGRDLLPRRRVAARERRTSAPPTTPRSALALAGDAGRPGRVPRRGARLRREPRAGRRSRAVGRSRWPWSRSRPSRSRGRVPGASVRPIKSRATSRPRAPSTCARCR